MAGHKKKRDFEPMKGTELLALYDLARRNMLRGTVGHAEVKYETAEALRKAIVGYWDYLEDQNTLGNPLIPDVEGLATYLGVSRDTLRNWETGRTMKGKGFDVVVAQAKNDIAACKKQLGQLGNLPPIVMAMDFNNNHGYVQKNETVVEVKDPLGTAKPTSELMEKYRELIDEPVIEVLPESTEDNK